MYLFNYMQSVILSLRNNGKIRTAETYTTTLNSFKKFRLDKDISLNTLDTKLMDQYQAWLKSQGVTSNTISFYNRILRALYNRAVGEDLIHDRQPFRNVYTGVAKTVKRAVSLSTFKKIRLLDLSHYPAEEFARDMFLLSFMLRGMSFIDMAFLKKSDLSNNHITYHRRKTGQRLSIQWTKEMQAILDKYPENESTYLLPVITKKGINERCAYKNMGYKINNSLKKISRMLHLRVPLTMYVARHSWASIAHSNGIPLRVISEGLGHDSEKTTRIYLATLDNSIIDQANRQLLSLI